MKIKNDLVSLKIGNKQYDFNNLIFDEYLKRFVSDQFDIEKYMDFRTTLRLQYCLVKFDIPFENLQANTELHSQDFDICFIGASINQDVSENQIIVQYDYDTSFIYDYKTETGGDYVQIDNYYERKITAIGFTSFWISDEGSETKIPVCAILDTSNYNIYLQKNQDLSITRRDIITTDALFYSNDKKKVPGPAHLAPFGVPQIIYKQDIQSGNIFYDCAYGILHSVGLSSYPHYIDKEFILGQDLEVEVNGTEFSIKGLENYLLANSPLFCNYNIYPSTSLYPIKSNYKYVIFKYKVYQMVNSQVSDSVTDEVIDTGYYYYEAIPIDKIGKTNLKIKYERS